MKNAKEVIKWVVAVILLIVGLTILVLNPERALLYFLIAGFILPPVQKCIVQDLKIVIPSSGKYIIVLTGIFLAGISGDTENGKPDNKEADTSTHSKVPTNNIAEQSDRNESRPLNDDNQLAKKSDPVSKEFVGEPLAKNTAEFKHRFNAFVADIDVPLRIRKIKMTKGSAVNTFECSFNENIALLGFLNKKDDSLTGILVIGQGDGSLSSGLDIFIVIGAAIAVTNPMLTLEERGTIIRRIMPQGNNKMSDNFSSATTMRGLKYELAFSEQTGLLFSITRDQ